MKMKTSELTGAALDWAVARCEEARNGVWATLNPPHYSSSWNLGGPIIEREDLSFIKSIFTGVYIGFVWGGERYEELARGETPLIAAMRCYVASKLGDEVEVPNELKGEK
jgi:Protein of unknown function (DUF2591)